METQKIRKSDERKLPRQTLLMLYGPMCSGKTTLSNLIFQNHDRIIKGSTDYLKWLISDCGLNKYKELNNQLTLSLIETGIKAGLSGIVEGNSHIISDLTDQYRKIAYDNNTLYLEINIEAPYKTLLERFNQRVKSGLNAATGTKLTIVDESEMKRRYDIFMKYRNPCLPTFLSDEHSPQEIMQEIMTLISKYDEHDAMMQPEMETIGGRK